MSIQQTDPSARLFRGVSLAQYAAVQAGLGESFELDEMLAHAAIDPAAWPAAEDAWSDALLEGLEQENGVHEAFDEHLAAAQDRFGRRVPPIDEDLTAWLDFVRRWAADPEPVALLDRLSIGSTDVVRLHRSWSRRFALDPTLAQQALGILDREPGELPVLRPEPRVLGRPDAPAALRREVVAPADVEALRGDGTEPRVFVDLALWLSQEEAPDGENRIEIGAPALSEALGAPPSDGEETLPPTLSPVRRGLVLPFGQASAPRIQARGDETAGLAPVPAPHTPSAVAPGSPGAPALSGARTPASSDGEETLPPTLSPFRRGRELPFAEASQVPAPNDGEETLPPTLSPFRRGRELPFAEASAPRIQATSDQPSTPATQEPASPSAATHSISRTKPDLGATTDFKSGLLAAALPFMKKEGTVPAPVKVAIEPALPPQIPTVSPTHAVARPSQDLGRTGVLPTGLLAAALPFMKQDGAAPPAQAPSASSPRGIARPSPDLDSTGVLPAGLLAAALPFMKSTPAPTATPRDGRQPPAAPAASTRAAEMRPADARSAHPPPSPSVGPTPPRIDTSLTMAQYASLCAELAVFPAATEQIFQRYGLTAASQRVSIDRAWKARLQSNAVEHKEWTQLYQHYHAVLTEQARRGGPRG
jgi:hypothetical protein